MKKNKIVFSESKRKTISWKLGQECWYLFNHADEDFQSRIFHLKDEQTYVTTHFYTLAYQAITITERS